MLRAILRNWSGLDGAFVNHLLVVLLMKLIVWMRTLCVVASVTYVVIYAVHGNLSDLATTNPPQLRLEL